MKLRTAVHRLSSLAALLLTALLVAGCATRPGVGVWEGPKTPATVAVERWSYPDRDAKRATTGHYIIHTTIADEQTAQQLVQVMEGALEQYRLLAPNVPVSSRPMQCFVFARRSQWAAFTQRHTGPDAKIYLQINRGGYTVRDWFVAYFIGDLGTYTVAAHEGWHQFVARHFKGRLPPFLEEGIACMFENVGWSGDLPRWNVSINPKRAYGLRRAIEHRRLWPAEQLIAMHAGDIVNTGPEKIEAFYAQTWAFARFLWDGEGGKHRPALRQLMADTAAGSVFDPTGTHQRSNLGWNPKGVKPLLEHYLQMDWASIDLAYQRYIRKVAFEEFDAQWEL